jgi:hypothetical protein
LNVTPFVALYGAVLSTYSILRELLSRRARARVDCGYTVIGGTTLEAGRNPFVFAARIANAGRDPIFIASASAETTCRSAVGGGHLPGSEMLPKELKPGQSLTVYTDLQSIRAFASHLPHPFVRPVFVDQLGRRYRGRYIGVPAAHQEVNGWSLDDPQRITAVRQLLLRARIGRRSRLPTHAP